MTYHVAGIDLSLTNTGVAVLRGDQLGDRPAVHNVLSSPIKTGQRDGKGFSSLLDRRNRIQQIVARVAAHALAGYNPDEDDAPLFVIEAPFYGAGTASASLTDRAWLFGLTCHVLFKNGLIVEVATTTMKKYATGSGATPSGAKSSKSAVLLAIPRMFPQVVVTDDNAADALALAAMGARALGHPREPSPQRVHPAALASVEWPSNTARRNHDAQ